MSETAIKSTLRFDWFQAGGKVTIILLKRNVSSSDCSYECDGKQLRVKINDELVLSLELYDDVVASTVCVNCTSSKVELSLEKLNCKQWPSLASVVRREPEVTTCKQKPNWDAMAKAAEKEEEEAADGIDKLFRTIYKDSSDDVRKAMIKSFTESQGTVLSTNWGEVGKKSVDVTPPDDMEYKKY